MSTPSRIAHIASLVNRISRERILITIDGPCGSGKSTLASELASAIGAEVVHMDDFVIPHAQKTPERLAVPGGNADSGRLLSEVLHPWLSDGHATYRPYLCHTDAFGDPVAVNGSLLILEGSYSNLPCIREHAALRLFISVPSDEQQRRLLQRVGPERLQAFNDRWIPLEAAYFTAFSLPDKDCVQIDACYAQVE